MNGKPADWGTGGPRAMSVGSVTSPRWVVTFVALLLLGVLLSCERSPTQQVLTMATTTSVENSGLMSALVPAFERKYGVKVRYVAVGTGAAIRTGRDGNADMIFVHDKAREEAFVRQGYGEKRYEVMKNYFTVVGPEKYEKGLKGKRIRELLTAIAAKGLPFVSRGDKSGTHSKELALWQICGVKLSGPWYIEGGSGMVATLRVADEKEAFAITDKATYLAHKAKLKLISYTAEDPLLLNVYSMIPVSTEKFPEARADLAGKFVRFVLAEEGREIVRTFGRERFGEPLFQLLENP